jgi:hypothetical protein
MILLLYCAAWQTAVLKGLTVRLHKEAIFVIRDALLYKSKNAGTLANLVNLEPWQHWIVPNISENQLDTVTRATDG